MKASSISSEFQFENGSEFSYKSIICADGIHSLGKKTIFDEGTFEKPDHSGFCIYYGLMSDYPETMQYPGAYEIDCDGELILMMPLKDKECLMWGYILIEYILNSSVECPTLYQPL